jgi:hypothetical protein
MTPVAAHVRELIPMVNNDVIERLGLHPHTDMSRSNQCGKLTLSLYGALVPRDITSRRELHLLSEYPENYHYLIAHVPAEETPSDRDIITDLNPWQFTDSGRSGYLHDERHIVQEILADAGAPEWFVAMRGISSIAEIHTSSLSPFAIH